MKKIWLINFSVLLNFRKGNNSDRVTCCCHSYQDGKLYMIDVSQSVEHDHPHALEFLRTDCTNITGMN